MPGFLEAVQGGSVARQRHAGTGQLLVGTAPRRHRIQVIGIEIAFRKPWVKNLLRSFSEFRKELYGGIRHINLDRERQDFDMCPGIVQ